MCGRLTLTHPNDALARLFDAAPANDLPDPPRYNVCPTDTLPVVSVEAGARRLVPMRWGFLPGWYTRPEDGPLLINARAETLAEKPSFRAACRERRCLIPASGYYEWTKGADGARLPWYIHPKGAAPLALAGVWQHWQQGDTRLTTCAIVTTSAAPKLQAIHHRMPVVIAPNDWPLWLGEAGHGAARLMAAETAADPAATLQFHRVARTVNSNRASGPNLIAPQTDPLA